ncbi:kinesin-like protein KIF18B isoform X2 [Pomacea canaliculata]|uniref:kinesin-like protein KIF18B isoform X2 n=1 Tax=Pomacea canaliculata TaxID=400727 RepID=UPI000D73A762|nr:kinesin-like protein KIF18B isoform X2 [Pomacea canaliculata]
MTVYTSPQSCQENNVMESQSNSVRVVVRVRPQNDLECNGHHRSVVEVVNENVLVFDPKEEASSLYEHKGKHRDIQKRREKDLKFAFDHVFGAGSTNEEVFEQTTFLVLDGLLSGYNCSVFAYGATGAGKTHTMLGNQSQPGVIYHTMIQLYQRINEISAEKTCDIAVSYLEVYNEQIRDLLLPRGTLPVREDRNAGVIIPGLSLHKPQSAEELLHMLQFGNKNRTQHPTDANAESSRSHAVFQVFVRQRDRTAGLSAEVKVAKMCLVDLAGSERATVTKNRGARLREGANINRSLLALGNVINALADQKFKGHIPYRDSKLTRLLKDSLGGNCRTIMIAAVSPSGQSYEDTYNTLKYADRAKNIRLSMKRNVLSVDFHVSRYGHIVEELRKEIRELKIKLQEKEESKSIKSTVLYLPSDLQALRENLSQAHAQCRQVREEQLQQETNVRDVQWRLQRKRKTMQRAMYLSGLHPEVQHKVQAAIHGLQQKLVGQEGRRQILSAQLQEKSNQLQKLQAQASSLASVHPTGSLLSQYLALSMHSLELEGDLQDTRQYIHHLRRLARAQEREAQASEWLISALLKLVQMQKTHLMNHGPLPEDILDSFHSLSRLIGESSVSWGDDNVQVDDGQPAFNITDIINIPMLSVAGLQVSTAPEHRWSEVTSTNMGRDGVKDQDSNTTGVNYDASCRKQTCKYDTQALAESPTLRQETVYAGHTPAHKKALYTSTVAGAAETKRHSSHEAADQVQEDKENQFVLGHPCSHAARAIKFDDAFASPVRAEMKSYADAVKTPSPARLVLQNLDYNSPQVLQTRQLSGQISKTTPRVLYPSDAQVYDTVQQLKQFGLPSLVENHVTASKTTFMSNCKPSYMLTTKSVAQRNRLQPKTVSKDDAVQTKHILSKNFSHYRSKSVSNLTRAGWKI